jgi:hypothetical protein
MLNSEELWLTHFHRLLRLGGIAVRATKEKAVEHRQLRRSQTLEAATST